MCARISQFNDSLKVLPEGIVLVRKDLLDAIVKGERSVGLVPVVNRMISVALDQICLEEKLPCIAKEKSTASTRYLIVGLLYNSIAKRKAS